MATNPADDMLHSAIQPTPSPTAVVRSQARNDNPADAVLHSAISSPSPATAKPAAQPQGNPLSNFLGAAYKSTQGTPPLEKMGQIGDIDLMYADAAARDVASGNHDEISKLNKLISQPGGLDMANKEYGVQTPAQLKYWSEHGSGIQRGTAGFLSKHPLVSAGVGLGEEFLNPEWYLAGPVVGGLGKLGGKLITKIPKVGQTIGETAERATDTVGRWFNKYHDLNKSGGPEAEATQVSHEAHQSSAYSQAKKETTDLFKGTTGVERDEIVRRSQGQRPMLRPKSTGAGLSNAEIDERAAKLKATGYQHAEPKGDEKIEPVAAVEKHLQGVHGTKAAEDFPPHPDFVKKTAPGTVGHTEMTDAMSNFEKLINGANELQKQIIVANPAYHLGFNLVPAVFGALKAGMNPTNLRLMFSNKLAGGTKQFEKYYNELEAHGGITHSKPLGNTLENAQSISRELNPLEKGLNPTQRLQKAGKLGRRGLNWLGTKNAEVTFDIGQNRIATALYASLRQSGKDAGTAANETRRAMGDAGNTQNWEKNAKWAMYWYDWTKGLVKFWTKALFVNPQMTAGLGLRVKDYRNKTGDPTEHEFAGTYFPQRILEAVSNPRTLPDVLGNRLNLPLENALKWLYTGVTTAAFPEQDYKILYNKNAPLGEAAKQAVGTMTKGFVPAPLAAALAPATTPLERAANVGKSLIGLRVPDGPSYGSTAQRQAHALNATLNRVVGAIQASKMTGYQKEQAIESVYWQLAPQIQSRLHTPQ